MNENLISRIERDTKTFGLDGKNWKEVVDTVILPKMAGPVQTRWCINDMFMNLVADYAYELSLKDRYTATAMMEIGLQRLSCGAVLHEGTPWPEPLPKEYWSYSSKWDEAHVMTEGCYNFIMKALEECIKHEMTRSHALAVAFGLMAELTANGECSFNYYALSNFKDKAAVLYAHAERLAEKYATFEELYAHYSRPNQWHKHRLWFSKNWDQLDWKTFFADTCCVEGNFFQRWLRRNSIKRELKRLAMPVVA